ncbi:MAG: hypothetical protein AAFZ18_22625 [Myxococcota bacterium]
MRGYVGPLLGLAAGVGCVSVNGHREATPVAPGQVEALAAAGGFYESEAGWPAPLSALGVRVGIASGIDVGAVLGPVQLRLDATFRLVEAGPLTLSLSPAVAAGALGLESSENLSAFFTADASLLATIGSPRVRGTVFVGPGVGFIPPQEGREGVTGFLIRQGGGVRFWVLPRFGLHPEAVVTTDAGQGYAVVDAAFSLGFVLRFGDLETGS